MRHGVDLYKQTINLKNNPPTPFPENPPPVYVRKSKPGSDKEEDSKHPESKYRRVAKFLILIGSEQAAEILAELDPDQVEEISKEIALVKTIKPEEGEKILAEFHNLFSRPYIFSGKSRGGIEAARRILYAAKGPEKGEAILNKAIPASKENLFSFLEEFSAEQLVMLLKPESPQTIALILSRLPPKLSAETISKLPPDTKPEVLKRIAYQKEISPEVLEQVTAGLKEKARNISGGAGDIEIDGMQALAAILKQGDYDFGDKIISELEQSSPDLGKSLKEKIYTLDDVVYTVDRSIQQKLALMSDQEIAILMKGRGKQFCEKILSCVSVGRRKLIREEFEILGAVPKRDCDAAAGEFLSWFRKAREDGDIILYSDKDIFI
ncbi:MAG: flagellar motor switch protein FliG [Treponema sp.]|jgi:flagellar motor switch protein FliG|nr:flagellar motor switch protein FliG [Treponema sp.]